MATKPTLRRAVPNSKIKAADYNFNFDQLNDYIEQGTTLATYEPSAEYKKDQWVLAGVDGEFGIYQSLVDGNKGTSLLDGTYWKKVSLGAGLEIGDIGIAPLGIDETKGKRRYLNGQLIIQEQYVQFTNKVKSAIALYPSLACTESEWQTTATMTVGGQVGKFVVDDEAGTIRLPKIIMPIQGLTDLSKLAEIVEAGLPNITGSIENGAGSDYRVSTNNGIGALSTLKNDNTLKYGTGGLVNRTTGIKLDASLSNPIYGNSDTVQQEQIQYPYFIQVATGAETEDNIINEIELNNPFSLLDYKYSEYELNNLSWLRSEGQYNTKAVYPAVYDLLLKIYNGTETKAGVSVKLHTEDYTDEDFVINQDDETFRLQLKVKLASGKAVVGNGMSLGITEGVDNFGFIHSSSGLVPRENAYGVQVGASASGSSTADTGVAFGVTTDPNYSGIETSDSGLYLYFYVGETVQNANLVNIGRIQETMVTNTMVDGQWVQKYAELSSATAIGSYTLDLSDYLPNDGYAYEVMFYIAMASGNTTVYTLGTVSSPWTNKASCFCATAKTTTNARFATANFILPIKNRVVYSEISEGAVSSSGGVVMVGYRRLGTNQ